MMDELPAIIHRLSLQLWCPDQANKGTETPQEEDTNDQGVNPFASPPEDPVDVNGNLLDPNSLTDVTSYDGVQSQSLFSQRNLLRLATLTDSHRTLSLFTPGIRDVVFRAWSAQGDKSDPTTPAFAPPSLTRTISIPTGASTTYTFSDSGSNSNGHMSSRPSSINLQSVGSGLALGTSGRARPGRKRKNRVVNLRRSKSQVDVPQDVNDLVSDVASVDAPFSEPLGSEPIPEDRAIDSLSDIVTAGKVRFSKDGKQPGLSPRQHLMPEDSLKIDDAADLPRPVPQATQGTKSKAVASKSTDKSARSGKGHELAASAGGPSSETSSDVLEHAWISKMAGEIARRVYDEKSRHGMPASRGSLWEDPEDAPPAYEAATQ
jgi:distribution and morphology protein 34